MPAIGLSRSVSHAFASTPVFTPSKNFIKHLRDTRNVHLARTRYHISSHFLKHSSGAHQIKISHTAMIINKTGHSKSISFGKNTVVRGIIRVEKHGEFLTGERVYIGDNALLSVAKRVIVEEGVLIAHNVQIYDNDSHPISETERIEHFRAMVTTGNFKGTIKSDPVVIQRNSWLATGVIVLKGTTVGRGSVIGAGAILKGSYPPNSKVSPAISSPNKKATSRVKS